MATRTEEKAQPRKRAAHLGPERRRPEVLDAALKLFLKGGYDGTSMQAVANEAGVTKPVVYACFDSKDELFRALLRREEDRILAEIQEAFKDADLSDPETTLSEGFTGFLRAVGESPDVYRLDLHGGGRGQHRRRRPDSAWAPSAGRLAQRVGAELARGPERRGTRRRRSRRRPAWSAIRSPAWARRARAFCSPARTTGRRRPSAASSAGWPPRPSPPSSPLRASLSPVPPDGLRILCYGAVATVP